MNEPAQGGLSVEVVDQFSDKFWRLSNLYYIVNENGEEVHFVPNEMQLLFLEDMWYLNLILKARQHGFTTLIDLWILDECVFHPNQRAGIIAHNLDDAGKIFRQKIKHPYEKLPAGILEANPATNDKAQELVFKNKSELSVATSMRSGTLQYLHISEFGKISAKFPDKAVEIVTGSFNTVHPGNYVFVESTAEGRQGEFYNMVKNARDRDKMRRPLTKMDFKFHFYPWWANDKYQFDDEDAKNVVFLQSHTRYFQKLEAQLMLAMQKGERWAHDWARVGPVLSIARRAWYVKKKELMGDNMKREYPSTPDEAFEASIQGAYFSSEMSKAREQGRITRVPHERALAVDTWWDLGRRDMNAIWFTQSIGREVRVINYHEDSERSLVYFLTDLFPKMQRELNYHWGTHTGPHDMSVTEYSTGVMRWQTAKNLGYVFQVCPQIAHGDQVEAARNFLGQCWFDEAQCEKGLTRLENYRKQWNEHLSVWMETPLHDENSHGASAFMTMACMFNRVATAGTVRAQQVQTPRFAT
jgi:hypothetical protein